MGWTIGEDYVKKGENNVNLRVPVSCSKTNEEHNSYLKIIKFYANLFLKIIIGLQKKYAQNTVHDKQRTLLCDCHNTQDNNRCI
jgi:hypothetical protein